MRSSARLLGAALLVVVLTSGLRRHLTLRSHTAQTGSLRVTVFVGDPPAAMGAATVQLTGHSIAAVTNSSGIALLQGLIPGTYVVQVRRIGYCVEHRNVTVSAGVETSISIWLCHDGDAVITPGDGSTELIAALGLRIPPGTGCEPDKVIQGSSGVALIGDNALPLSACHGMAWVLTPGYAPVFSNTAGDFPWSDGSDDVYAATLPARRLRVATTIWISDIAPALPGPLITDLSTTILPEANTMLRDNFSGILLVKDEAGDALPEIIDVTTVTTPTPYVTIGKDCTHVNDIKATPALYHSDKLNIYYVGGGEVSYAGFNCFAQGAPNIIYMKAGGSYFYTLLHEVAHGLGLTRPSSGHTDNLPGFFGTGTEGYPTLNLMGQYAVAPSYFSVGQVIRMHADDESWLNAADAGGATIRSRQLTGTLLVTRCGCPESVFTDDCPRLRADIARSDIERTVVPSPMACYVKADACVPLGAGSTGFDVRGFADAALTVHGSGVIEVFSLTPAIVTATLADPTVTVTRVGAGTGQLRVSAGGSYALVQVPTTCTAP